MDQQQALVQLLQRQDALERALLSMGGKLDGIREGIAHEEAVLHLLALSDAGVVLDLLQQSGLAEQRFFAASTANGGPISVAATATATAVDLQPGSQQVGFWRRLDVEPDTSRVFSLQLTVDGTPVFRNPSVVPGLLIPSGVWLPFVSRFLVEVTNNDGIAAHEIDIVGTRIFLDAPTWQQIRRFMAVVVKHLYTEDLPPEVLR